ncbi:MAG: 5'-nucleotidase C-terminal domain-containing protein [Clostridia bacterium]|nr:5'-nucleotidase C-terminal domain-containing protein [Clostridia bacterium]
MMKRKLSVVLILAMVIAMALPTMGYAEEYVIQDGDVLWKIARDHGMDYETLAAVNNIENPNLIYAGDTLNVNLVKKIDILSTNDFHGQMEGGYEAGAAKLAAYLTYYKDMNAAGTIILDAGDSFQGSPMSNLLYGEPVIRFFNEVGYAATVVGNHEFDWGIDKITDTMEKNNAEYPLLTANVYKDGALVEWATPYTIEEVNGIMVGIIGISTPDTAVTAHKDFVGEYTFENPIAITNAMVKEVEAKGAEIVIVLGHLPAEQDRDTQEVIGELADLANEAVGIDAAIGGHSHMEVAGKVNDIPVVMAYKHGRAIGHITLYYDTVTDEVVMSDVVLHDVRKGDLDVEENTVIAGYVAEYAAELEPIFGEVVGTFTAPLVRDYNTTSSAGNWFADVMRAQSGVDFAFTNAGGVRADLPEGEITVEDIFLIMPFDNKTVTSEMTGKDIVDLLEQGCTLSKGMLQISGLTFTYDSSKPDYEKVVAVTMADGTPLDLEKTYTVATNDFLALGQDNYVTLANFTFTDPYQADLIRDQLIAELKAAGTYTPDTTLRAVDIAE